MNTFKFALVETQQTTRTCNCALTTGDHVHDSMYCSLGSSHAHCNITYRGVHIEVTQPPCQFHNNWNTSTCNVSVIVRHQQNDMLQHRSSMIALEPASSIMTARDSESPHSNSIRKINAANLQDTELVHQPQVKHQMQKCVHSFLARRLL